MNGWFNGNRKVYNNENVDESAINDELIGKSNPFISLVSDIEEFELVTIGSPVEEDNNGSSDSKSDLSK